MRYIFFFFFSLSIPELYHCTFFFIHCSNFIFSLPTFWVTTFNSPFLSLLLSVSCSYFCFLFPSPSYSLVSASCFSFLSISYLPSFLGTTFNSPFLPFSSLKAHLFFILFPPSPSPYPSLVSASWFPFLLISSLPTLWVTTFNSPFRPILLSVS